MNAPAVSRGDDPVLDIIVTRGADGRSRLVRKRVSYPWSLGRGYPSSGDSRAVTIIPQAAGAGLLAGDRFRQHITVAPGASLRVAPAGATLVHGALPPRTSRSCWSYVLQASAAASVVTEPYVLMEDADLALRQNLVVDADAVLVTTETVVLAPGVSRASWRLETSVLRTDGTPIFDDIQVAATGGLRRIRRLPGTFDAFTTVLVFAPPACLKGLDRELVNRIDRAGSALWGACAHLRAAAGLGIRLAGHDGGQVRDMARELHEVAEAAIGI